MPDNTLDHPPRAHQIWDYERGYLHAALCQISLPYRSPKDRVWTRRNGSCTVRVEAGSVATHTPSGPDFEPLELPCGPRARLVLIYLMTQAVLNRSPVVDMGDSLRAFARMLGIHTGGRDLRALREQLRRLSVCSMRIAWSRDGHAPTTVQGHLVSHLDVFPTDPSQRALWHTNATLGDSFFASLMDHAVPLAPAALRELKHSATALDTYAWLAHRLCRIETGRTVSLGWQALHAQLGGATRRVASWRQSWLGEPARGSTPARIGTLQRVLAVYPAAREGVMVTPEGLELRQCAPPTPKLENSALSEGLAGLDPGSDLALMLSDGWAGLGD